MAASEPYRISRRAEADLDVIWHYSAKKWSPAQAERYYDHLLDSFARLTEFPQLGRFHATSMPPVRIHPTRQHLVIYTDDAHGITILRVLGAAQDWGAVLAMLEV